MAQSGNVSPNVPQKLLAGGPLKIQIGIGSFLILTIGAWLAPRATQRTLSAPEERAAPLIEEQVQLRTASRTFTGVQDVGVQVRSHGVAIPAAAVPTPSTRSDYSDGRTAPPRIAGFGVFVSDAGVLTHASALDGRTTMPLVTAGGRSVDGAVIAYEPATGLVLLRTEAIGIPAPILTAAAPSAGALVVAAVRWDQREIAAPLFVTDVGGDRFMLGTAGADLLPGMPVYTMAGELFAIAGPDEGQLRAIPAREGAERLLARAASGERLSSFGVAVQALDEQLASVFGESGVVITNVVPGGPAELAGVQAADVLLTVGGVEVNTPDAAMDALSATGVGTATRLGLRRERRLLEVEAAPAAAYEVAALARAIERGAPALEARAALTPTQLEAGGVPPTARVVAVDGEAVTSRAQLQRVLLAARAPVPVLLRHEGRQFFAAIEPAR
jgi:serine protease Do